MLPRLGTAALAVAALAVAPASANAVVFKVVSATHTSSSTKSVQNYSGTSTATWKLSVPGKINIQKGGGSWMGLATLGIRGAYKVDVTTPSKQCAIVARTGDPEYSGLAPSDLNLTFGPDPRTGRGLIAAFGATSASLSNAYLPSECSTSISGEPDPETTNSKPIKPSALKKKKLTLRYNGSSAEDDIAYEWSTTIVLKRRR